MSVFLAVLSPYQLSDDAKNRLKQIGYDISRIQRVTVPPDRDGIEVWWDDTKRHFIGRSELM